MYAIPSRSLKAVFIILVVVLLGFLGTFRHVSSLHFPAPLIPRTIDLSHVEHWEWFDWKTEDDPNSLTSGHGGQSNLHAQSRTEEELGSQYYNDTERGLRCQDLEYKDVAKLQSLVFFFGFNRCGSTAVGAVIDAHPNAFVGNELNLFGELDQRAQKAESLASAPQYKQDQVRLLLAKWACAEGESHGSKGIVRSKGYTIQMGPYSGRWVRPLMIAGFRKSRITTKSYINNPMGFTEKFGRLRGLWRGVKGVMVVRNVYDMLASFIFSVKNPIKILETGEVVRISDHTRVKELKREHGAKTYEALVRKMLLARKVIVHVTEQYVDDRIGILEQIANASTAIQMDPNLLNGRDYLVVRINDLIAHPDDGVRRLCSFLQLPCYPQYIQGVKQGLLTDDSVTRFGVNWSEPQLQRIHRISLDYPQLFSGMTYQLPSTN